MAELYPSDTLYPDETLYPGEEIEVLARETQIVRSSVDWKFFLVNSETLEKLGEIKEARGRSLQLALNKPGGCDFTVPLSYGLFKDVAVVKYGIIAYRNDIPRYSGMIWGLNEDSENNSIRVSTIGWFELLNHRIFRQEVGYPPFGSGTITAGEIVFADSSGTPGAVDYFPGGILTITNDQRDTWISEGTSTDKMLRVISYAKGQSIGQSITQLTEIEAGFDFTIDPKTRVMDITNWDEVPDKTDQVIYGFNWGPSNIKHFGRQIDPSTMTNRFTALGKFGGGFAEDVESQEEFQLFEEQVQLSESTDPNVMLAYAGGEVVLRSQPRTIYSFEPFPYAGQQRVPQIFEDYDIGDKVSFTSIKMPRWEIRKQKARVFGANITITDEGNEKISALQISP